MTQRLCFCDKTGFGRSFDYRLDCLPCWLWYHFLEYRVKHGGDYNVIPIDHQPELRNYLPKDLNVLPDMIKQVIGFSEKTAQQTFSGFKIADDNTRRTRLIMCSGCDSLDKQSSRCQKCGSLIQIKTAWAEQLCPLGKW